MNILESDKRSHFKNSIMQQQANEFLINHYFATELFSWDSSIDSCCMQEVVRACEALLTELKLVPHT